MAIDRSGMTPDPATVKRPTPLTVPAPRADLTPPKQAAKPAGSGNFNPGFN